MRTIAYDNDSISRPNKGPSKSLHRVTGDLPNCQAALRWWRLLTDLGGCRWPAKSLAPMGWAGCLKIGGKDEGDRADIWTPADRYLYTCISTYAEGVLAALSPSVGRR